MSSAVALCILDEMSEVEDAELWISKIMAVVC